MGSYRTEQEAFWAGDFGNEYTERNSGAQMIASNTALFSSILTRTQSLKSVLEFGANRGQNLIALHTLLPDVEISAIEINQQAVNQLSKLKWIKVYHQSILDFTIDYPRDLVFSKGVLIHINPEELPQVYQKLYESSGRYICLIEYFNPTPVEIDYRGHSGKLFKRDFAGEMLDVFSDLCLIDYGFVYRRDSMFPQGDLTWFLMEKQNNK